MLQSEEIQDENYLLPIVFFRHKDLDILISQAYSLIIFSILTFIEM